jgi:hypothetical protein
MNPLFEPATERQKALLYHLLPPDERYGVERLTKQQASEQISLRLDDDTAARYRHRPTAAQRAFLERHGQWHPILTRQQASERIAEIKEREEARKLWPHAPP